MLPSLSVYTSLVVPSPAVSFPSSIASTMTLGGPCHFGLRDSENTHGGNSAPIQSRQSTASYQYGLGERATDPWSKSAYVNISPDFEFPMFVCSLLYLFSRHFLARFRIRMHPVSRTQFSLAPAFAITAHVAQGQTIPEGVLTDLCVGPGGNPFTAYVAFTRVQGRAQLFIYRAFDAAPFQKGIGLGRDLLLRQLRGERIDWKALLARPFVTIFRQ
jgi:hypothetical protein